MYLVYDTETTGLPKSYDAPLNDFDNWPRVVQLAWQIHDFDGSLAEVKNFIVKPEDFIIPRGAEKIHGISTDRANREGQPLDFVLNLLRDFTSWWASSGAAGNPTIFITSKSFLSFPTYKTRFKSYRLFLQKFIRSSFLFLLEPITSRPSFRPLASTTGFVSVLRII